MADDRMLIEDYLPIEAISKEASREKSVRKGHISTLHLWWARRPLVACRAAVYGALVPTSRFSPKNGHQEKRESLTRANAAKFVERLCQYPGNPQVIGEAQHHILTAHAERLTREIADWKADKSEKPGWVEEFKFVGEKVREADIADGRAPRPRVLDMFAGGGAIPLEALRLGCEAYALDLNPVAHIIELGTLVYPQKYSKPDPTERGMTGPAGKDDQPTWGGLAKEVRYWGEWVLQKLKAEIGDLYPPIPDPDFKSKRQEVQMDWLKEHTTDEVPPGYLLPVAYLWTRTVTCKNPSCGATVPLVKQTWLCRKAGRYAALKMIPPRGKKKVRFEIAEAYSESGLGFDPTGFSKGGNAACPFCGTVADIDHVKAEGCAARLNQQMMAIVCVRPGKQGKVYVSADDLPNYVSDDEMIAARVTRICSEAEFTLPSEPVPQLDSFTCKTHLYGLRTWASLFNARQLVCLLTLASSIKSSLTEMKGIGIDLERSRATATYLAFVLDRLADWNSALCSWSPESTGGAKIGHTFGRQALHMVWDYAESAVWGEATGSVELCLDWVIKGLDEASVGEDPAQTFRGSATAMQFGSGTSDAVITDPPYYDNVSYANLSDFFYVWLKRSIGSLYSDHFAGELTPKRNEAIAESARHGGSKTKARLAYEEMMAQAFAGANRVLKPNGQLAVVYAHKTTLGWATLVDALRRASFTVTEAWPLDTEMKARLLAMDTAALASSIFLVARKRHGSVSGNYEEQVKGELDKIVRERVETLWAMGISGADLVIACVGAGLRAFTQFARVEYANGEEMPAERFLTEVETAVLQTVLARLSKEVSARGECDLASVDPDTRFYTLWRYTYRSAELDAGEAIIFANGTHVELDGPTGLSSRGRPLLEKKKGTYRLLDYTDRGDGNSLGVPSENGQPTPLIDALHRTLWLMENRPGRLDEFLREARPPLEQMRLVAQALAGPALKVSTGDQTPSGSTQPEQAALGKLLANWRSLMDQPAAPLFDKP
jgi:putative DNA methylase